VNAISTGITGLALLLASASACPQGTRDELAKGFANPPDSAKPRTWWHWTNGNISEPGITRDLEWMQRSGIGGFQLVDVGLVQVKQSNQKFTSARPSGTTPCVIRRLKPNGLASRCRSFQVLAGARRAVHGSLRQWP
jgi:hypothetical protein